MFFVTTAPAPITTSSQISTGKIVALLPTRDALARYDAAAVGEREPEPAAAA